MWHRVSLEAPTSIYSTFLSWSRGSQICGCLELLTDHGHHGGLTTEWLAMAASDFRYDPHG